MWCILVVQHTPPILFSFGYSKRRALCCEWEMHLGKEKYFASSLWHLSIPLPSEVSCPIIHSSNLIMPSITHPCKAKWSEVKVCQGHIFLNFALACQFRRGKRCPPGCCLSFIAFGAKSRKHTVHYRSLLSTLRKYNTVRWRWGYVKSWSEISYIFRLICLVVWWLIRMVKDSKPVFVPFRPSPLFDVPRFLLAVMHARAIHHDVVFLFVWRQEAVRKVNLRWLSPLSKGAHP